MTRGLDRSLALLLLAGAALTAEGSNWPQFRGPNGAGLSENPLLADSWNSGKNVAWKIVIPGFAWSSPVVWDHRLFVTNAVTGNVKKPKQKLPNGEVAKGSSGGMYFGVRKPPEDVYQWEVICLDARTGKVIWKQLAAERKPPIPTHPTNTYATETPVTDGKRLYAYFGMLGLYCFDMDGKPLWKKELGVFPMAAGFGTGSSPILVGDLLIVQCDNDAKSFLVALDSATGNERWRIERTGKSSWSTPIVWKSRVRTELVACGGGRVSGHDPATGKEFWHVDGTSGGFAASPVADDQFVYFGNSGPTSIGPLYALKAGASGDLTLAKGQTSNEGIAWYRTRSGPGLASPILLDGLLYVPTQGILTCFDGATGAQVYRERIQGAKQFTASPWVAKGLLYFLDEDGQTFVIKPGRKMELVAKHQLDDEMYWSSPAIADGSLFIRGSEHLYCIRP